MTESSEPGPDIAIIGMVGRFPGAPDLDMFWRNVQEGRSAIRRLDDSELDALGVTLEERREPNYVPASAPLEGLEQFDAAFFGYSPREAEILDPQQRIFLECAWEALESAGYDPSGAPGSVGVFAGATTSNYLLLNLASRPELMGGGGALQLLVGNAGDTLATRVSYKLDLRGPSFTVQSACSTSLLAVHLACQSLLNEECDLALAGGVSVNLAHRGGYLYVEGSILAPDGRCSPFDASARGTVFGSGVGVVVLKRLSEAIADGDWIRAVIRGSAVNNDGRHKAGFTAPSVDGQAAVIAEALALSGLGADALGYVEAHGTGTSLGDPIEIQALTRAFRATTQRKGFCALGSLKGTIGHLDVAAGVAGLIKTVLCLENAQIPPSHGFGVPNPQIDFAQSPVYVSRALTPWRASGSPRRAGVSSFGFGGTNVHAVLEEAPPRPARIEEARRSHELLVVSARTQPALEASSARLAAHLRAHPDLDLADVAYTLQTGRHAFGHRRVAVARDVAHAVELLTETARPGACAELGETRDTGVAFLFPGQGAQYPAMGAELFRTQSAFREAFALCSALGKPHLGVSLEDVVFTAAEGSRSVAETEVAQPALFAVEYALAKTWMAWGIRPQAMLGHSLGEYVAACLAGVFTLPEALSLVVARGRLMQKLPRGAMLSVALPEQELRGVASLDDGLSLAAVNEKDRCVVAGPQDAIARTATRLRAADVACRLLDTSHAFHSSMMDPILDEFRERVARARPKPPQLRFASNVTGTWIRAEQAVDPEYWARHLRETVRFADGLATLQESTARVFLEVGPGSALSAMARRAGATTAASMPAKPGGSGEMEVLLSALGALWLAGVAPEWASSHDRSKRRRAPLPTYPFERQRYWISPRRRAPSRAGAAAGSEPPADDQVLHPRPHVDHTFVGPRSDLERAIAEIWQRLLGIERVGVHDSFFAVGGDSLLATQVASRLRSTFGVEVPLERLLVEPTVAATACLLVTVLADRLEEKSLEELLAELRSLSPEELEAALVDTSQRKVDR